MYRRLGRLILVVIVRGGQGRAGEGRAGQGRAGQGRAGQGRVEQALVLSLSRMSDVAEMLFLALWFRVVANLPDRDVRAFRCTCTFMDFVVAEYNRCYGFAEVSLGQLRSERGVARVLKNIEECNGHVSHVTGSAVWIGGGFSTPAARRPDLTIEVMRALCSAKSIGLVQFGPLVGSLWLDEVSKRHLMNSISVVAERVCDVRYDDVELFAMCWWGRLKKAHLHIDLDLEHDTNEQLATHVDNIVGVASNLQVLRLTLLNYTDDDYERLVIPECFGAMYRKKLKGDRCGVTFVVPEFFESLDVNAKGRFRK